MATPAATLAHCWRAIRGMNARSRGWWRSAVGARWERGVAEPSLFHHTVCSNSFGAACDNCRHNELTYQPQAPWITLRLGFQLSAQSRN